MNLILLTGAGFSHNWGGWLASEAFEYLLGRPEVDNHGRDLLWKHKDKGFEEALSELQRAGGPALLGMEAAVRAMFEDMNRGFLAGGRGFEFSNDTSNSVARFLAKFDAIFTLNQDLLLELGYCINEPAQAICTRRTWSGFDFPGMRPQGPPPPMTSRFAAPWLPSDEIIRPKGALQPIYKLHGSSNWTDPEGRRLLVMGGDKTAAIGGSNVLTAYMEAFRQALETPDTRLVVIGYGFRDNHINMAIERAADQGGLSLFVIDPAGADAPDPDYGRALVRAPGPHSRRQGAIRGASRRPLARIFGGDTIERDKVLRFLSS